MFNLLIFIILLLTPSVALSENVKIEILGVVESGTELSGISTEAGEYFSFTNFTKEYDAIFDKCKVGDECSIVAVVDEHGRIVSVSSAELYQASEDVILKSNEGVKSDPNLFWGFRGVQWNSVVNLEDNNIIITYNSSYGGKKHVSFIKRGDNLMLGNVRLRSIGYDCIDGRFVGVKIQWVDREDLEISKIVLKDLLEQVGEVEFIESASQIVFVKNGIGFSFGQYLDVNSMNSLIIEANAKPMEKGTF